MGPRACAWFTRTASDRPDYLSDREWHEARSASDMLRTLPAGLALLVTLLPAIAHSDASLPDGVAPAETHDVHGFAEIRLGAQGVTAIGRPTTLQSGTALEGALGLGFGPFDVGFVSRFGALSANGGLESQRTFACGPEFAFRHPIGSATFRVGLAPTYALMTDGTLVRGRIGADLLVQTLFRFMDSQRPVWRAGVGLRAGRWSSTSGEGYGTTVGVDLIVRSWW